MKLLCLSLLCFLAANIAVASRPPWVEEYLKSEQAANFHNNLKNNNNGDANNEIDDSADEMDASESERQYSYFCDTAPQFWGEFSEICDFDRQSPINIIGKDTVVDPKLGDISYTNYDDTMIGSISNNGHGFDIELELEDESNRPYISGGGLPGDYLFLQFHMHWGNGDNPGSEHLVNYRQYPAELHLVHVREDIGTNSTAFIGDGTGLAVIGIFIDVGHEDNPNFQFIVDAVKSVTEFDGAVKMTNQFKLQDLLPKSSAFYRYLGSLTTPGCFESVVWTVMQEPLYISRNQLLALQQLQINPELNGGPNIVSNFRPAQPLNGRQVTSNRYF